MNIKNLLLIALIGLFIACKEEPETVPDYTILKGEITNPEKDKKLRLYNPESSQSILIDVEEDGHFLDTLRLDQPTYFNVNYNGIIQLYLRDGMDLTLNFDGEEIGKSLDLKGEGATANEFVRFKTKETQGLFGEDYRDFLTLEEGAYNKKKQTFEDKLNNYLKEKEDQLDSAFISTEKRKTEELLGGLDVQREQQLKINEELGEGRMSPQFEDYIDYEGGTASLEDFQGSYVYIDVWATWCVPCIYEMPFMKEVEEEYEGKNIKFIGLSLDNLKDEGKWRKMIVDKELDDGGSVQLLADKEMKSQFAQDYYISAIPRYILLDPKGQIISYDAPRPSTPELKEMFDELDM